MRQGKAKTAQTYLVAQAWKSAERESLMLLSFRIDGVPAPTQYQQARNGVLYSKPKTKEWQKIVGWAARAALTGSVMIQVDHYTGPVSVIVTFHMPIAKSQRKHYQPGQAHLQKPDVTNLWKGTEDGLKRILFADDATVHCVTMNKIWSDRPGVELRINLEEL